MRKLHISDVEANHLFTKLLRGKYLEPYEITVDGNIYYGYKVNLANHQVRMVVKIAGYMVG